MFRLFFNGVGGITCSTLAILNNPLIRDAGHELILVHKIRAFTDFSKVIVIYLTRKATSLKSIMY